MKKTTLKNLTLAALLAAATLSSQPALAGRSAPGAPKANGHFFEFRDESTGRWLRERDPYTYSTPTYIYHDKLPSGFNWVSRPLHWQPTIWQTGGQFLFLASVGGTNVLGQWSPQIAGKWQWLGAPSGTQLVAAPSKVMYGNRVYAVGADGRLYERFLSNAYGWTSFGYPLGKALRPSPPCVAADGDMWMVTAGGELIRMLWSTTANTWGFVNYGYPHKTLFTTVKAVGVGAAMSGKVFVTCSDGSLRQLWRSPSNGLWSWANHGNPYGYSVDSIAEAMYDGKLFVTANWANSRDLFQLYWNGSTWVWFKHGSGNILNAGLSLCPGVDRVFVQDTLGTPWECHWTNTWVWTAH